MAKQMKIDGRIGPFALVSVAMLFFLYDVFLQVSPSVMVQQLMHAFSLNALALGNLSASYFYIYTVMQIPVGLLYDRFGVRWLMVTAMAVCAVGAFVFGGSPNIGCAIFARFLMGLGSAFAFVGVLKIAAAYVSGNRFAMLVGFTTSLGMVGAMVANVSLTQMEASLGWRGSMIATGILGVIITVALFMALQRFKEPKHRRVHKHKSVWPLVYHLLGAMRRRSLWINALMAFLLYIPVAVFSELWAIPYLKQAQHFSSLHASIINSMLFFGVAVGAPLIGWCSDRIRRRKPFIMASGVVGCVCLALIIYIPNLPLFLALVLFFVTGFSAGSQSLNFCLANELTPPTIAATAFAFTNLVINVGVSVFQPVIGAILDAHWVGRLSHLSVPLFGHSTFSIALTVLPLAYLIVVVLLFMLPETHARLLIKK